MIVEAEKLGVKDEGLGDLSVLVDGFLQLIRSDGRATGAPPCRAPVARRRLRRSPSRLAADRPPPPRRGSSPAATLARRRRRAPSRSHAPPARRRAGGPRVYSIDDEDVSPPVAIDQRMPALPAEMTLDGQGAARHRHCRSRHRRDRAASWTRRSANR